MLFLESKVAFTVFANLSLPDKCPFWSVHLVMAAFVHLVTKLGIKKEHFILFMAWPGVVLDSGKVLFTSYCLYYILIKEKYLLNLLCLERQSVGL